LKSTFRGRELRGSTIQSPYQGNFHIQTSLSSLLSISHTFSFVFSGVVVRQEAQHDPSDEVVRWRVHKRFDKFISWNRETTPSENDIVARWMKWTEISSKVRNEKRAEKKEIQKSFNRLFFCRFMHL
jgi:hypothetical protein